MKTRRIIYQVVLIVSLALALLAPRPPVTHAATITVNDAGDGTQPRELPCAGCRLRDAIAAAASGDTIDFGGDFTINLVGSALSIGKNLTIDGAGHTVTISGPGASCTTCFRVFQMTTSNTLTLNNLTVTNGYSKSTGDGGAILIAGRQPHHHQLYLLQQPRDQPRHIPVWRRHLSKLATSPSPTALSRTTARTIRGGAIYFNGTNLTVTRSAFSNNRAEEGTNFAVAALSTSTAALPLPSPTAPSRATVRLETAARFTTGVAPSTSPTAPSRVTARTGPARRRHLQRGYAQRDLQHLFQQQRRQVRHSAHRPSRATVRQTGRGYLQ